MEAIHADVVISAVGAKPVVPNIPSIEKAVGLQVLEKENPELGQKVVILDAYWMHKVAMDKYLRDSKVKIQVNTCAKEIKENGILCSTKDDDFFIEADSVLLAAGMKSNRNLANDFLNTALGDEIKVGRVVDAVKIGYYRALDI